MRNLLGRVRRPITRSLLERVGTLTLDGDGSTLSLDFNTMSTLDPSLFTFSRSNNTATYINSSGYVTAASADVPRFDYDPTTLAPRGLLIEGSAINLVTRSDSLDDTSNISWLFSGMTRSSSTQVSPTGNSETVALVSGNGSFRSNNVTVTASTTYTFSFWAKNNSGTQARYRVWNVTAGSNIVDHSQSSSNYVSQLSNTAWTRISVTFTTPVGCTSIFVYPCSSDTTGTNVYLWGAQLEAGNSASSYVSSGTSQGQRAADSALIDGTKFSSWWTSPAAWSVFVDMLPISAAASSYPDPYRFINRTTTSNTSHFFYYGGSTYTLESRASNPTTNVSSQAASSQSYGSRVKVAHALADGTHLLSFNGTTKTTTTLAAMPTGLNAMGIMCNGLAGSSAVGNACIRAIKVWPFLLTQDQLNGLTA